MSRIGQSLEDQHLKQPDPYFFLLFFQCLEYGQGPHDPNFRVILDDWNFWVTPRHRMMINLDGKAEDWEQMMMMMMKKPPGNVHAEQLPPWPQFASLKHQPRTRSAHSPPDNSDKVSWHSKWTHETNQLMSGRTRDWQLPAVVHWGGAWMLRFFWAVVISFPLEPYKEEGIPPAARNPTPILFLKQITIHNGFIRLSTNDPGEGTSFPPGLNLPTLRPESWLPISSLSLSHLT